MESFEIPITRVSFFLKILLSLLKSTDSKMHPGVSFLG